MASSRVVQITNYVTSTVPGDDRVILLDKTQTLAAPVILPSESVAKHVWFRIASLAVSNSVPNIYNYGTFTNRLVKIRLGVAPWVDVQLLPGMYSAEDIGAAINRAAAALGWWIDPEDPGLIFTTNYKVNKINVAIDSTKTVGGVQLSIDLNSSSIGVTMGYSAAVGLMVADGVYESDITPHMDSQGARICVSLSEAPVRYVNGNSTHIIASIRLSAEAVNEVHFPNADELSPTLEFGTRQITSLSFRFTRDDGATPLLFLPGGGFSAVIEWGAYE